MKKNYGIGLGVFAIVVALILGWSFVHDDIAEYINNFILKQKQYTNLFEYAVDLEAEGYTYAPARLKYGMTMEEVLRAEGLEDSAIVDEDGSTAYTSKVLTDVTEHISELEFAKRFFVIEEYGLKRVTYVLTVDGIASEGFKELCSMVKAQAAEYMPEKAVEELGFEQGTGTLYWETDLDLVSGMPNTFVQVKTSTDDVNKKSYLTMEIWVDYADEVFLAKGDLAFGLVKVEKEPEEHTNFFEYAVAKNNAAFTYVPAQYSYGISMEEILDAEQLDKKAVWQEDGIYYVEKQETITDISENIKEAIFGKKFWVYDGYGLAKVEYSFEVEDEYFEELCDLMSKQAAEYSEAEDKAASQANILRARAGNISWGRQSTTKVTLYAEPGEKEETSVIRVSIEVVPEKVRKE